ncbi:MAG TPA: phosphotransferase family protein, partial [Kineosporiaceae bacterium]|nr:phosphotransferase family protein [Kineosporiaceae bacterium]
MTSAAATPDPSRPEVPGPDAPGPDAPGLDVPAVAAWLEAQSPGLLAGPPTAVLVPGGRSNLTYILDDGTRRFVLRRPPLGHVLATAHDMSREHRILSALHGTHVPVPEPIAICADVDVTGAPFYVMAFVDGIVLRRRDDIAPLSDAGRRQLVDAMMDVLADLHAVDPAGVGLADFGRPEGFMARQVRRWGRQLDASRSRDLPGIDQFRAALAASVPVDGDGTIVHGDYRLDNLVVAGPGEPDAYAVRAVLDWEMAALGDPLADLGLLVAYWDGLGASDDPVVAPIGPAAGLPAASALVARYAERSGRDISALAWYVAFGYFKILVILEGIHYRYMHGQTVGEGFDRIGEIVPGLVDEGRAAL